MAAAHSKRLGKADHRSLVLWAADCAEHVLPTFEAKRPNDERPREAIEAARAWVCAGTRGETRELLGESGPNPDSLAGSGLTLARVREAAFAAHAAARDADQAAACAAARAAGHAAATAHVAGHAVHAAAYAVKAVAYAASLTDVAAATDKERDWQVRHLPEHLRTVVSPARGHR